jgi:hypothetical protein
MLDTESFAVPFTGHSGWRWTYYAGIFVFWNHLAKCRDDCLLQGKPLLLIISVLHNYFYLALCLLKPFYGRN